MADPLISVIVPVYKVEQYLCRCVDSLLAQTYTNIEIILVDDGSPDRCGEICDDYACTDARIRVIHKENGGLSSARNAGIDVARGDYIGFVDSDDWVDSNSYEKLYHLTQKYDAMMVCAGRYDVNGATGEEKEGLCPKVEEMITGEDMVSRIFRWDHLDTAAWDKLYARELFATIRYPEGVTGEDLPVTYRLALEAGRCALGNFPFYHYYHRPGSITTSAFSEKDFHFPECAIEIAAYISENYPSLSDAAQFLVVRALGWTVQMLEISPKSTRKQYLQQYQKYKNLLRKNVKFILSCPYFTMNQRRDYLLISSGLYRLFRSIFHILKRAFTYE